MKQSITMRIESDLLKQIQQIAKEDGTTVSHEIRQAVRRMLNARKGVRLQGMATNKKGFLLYADQKELFEQLPDEIAGKLIKHIFKYVNDEEPETEDLLLKMAFIPIKQQLKRDLQKWSELRVKRSEAGKRSAEARRNKAQQNEQVLTSVESVEQTLTKSTVNVNDNVNVNVNVNDNVNVNNINNAFSEKLKKAFSDEGKKMEVHLFEYKKHIPELEKELLENFKSNELSESYLSTRVRNVLKSVKAKVNSQKQEIKEKDSDKEFNEGEKERRKLIIKQAEERRAKLREEVRTKINGGKND